MLGQLEAEYSMQGQASHGHLSDRTGGKEVRLGFDTDSNSCTEERESQARLNIDFSNCA